MKSHRVMPQIGIGETLNFQPKEVVIPSVILYKPLIVKPPIWDTPNPKT